MESRAKLFGHPIHQMLIPFPLGLLATSLVFDIVAMFTVDPSWHERAYWLIVAGIVGGLLAAVFGLIDYTAIPSGTRAKRVATLHGVGNVVVVALFALSWWLRRDAPRLLDLSALIASVAGVALATVTGWLGGELVDRLGVGVDDGAHLDAPSSLRGPARAR